MATWELIDSWLAAQGFTVPRPTAGQTVRPCASGSAHCIGEGARARDYGLGADVAGESRIALALVRLAQSGQLDELYHTPTGQFWKGGQRLAKPSRSLVDGHQDHVHAAVAPGVTALTGAAGGPGASTPIDSTSAGGLASLSAAAAAVSDFLEDAAEPWWWARVGAGALAVLLLLIGALVTFTGLSAGDATTAVTRSIIPKGAPA